MQDILHESKDSVKWDNNFKDKETYNLSSYKMLDVSSESTLNGILNNFTTSESKSYIKDLKKYFKWCMDENSKSDRTMKYIMWLDNTELVAYAVIQMFTDGVNYLTPLIISSSYRGHGLSTQIMKYLISKYKVNELTVNRDNKVAIELYKKLGFKFTDKYKDQDNDKNHLFMIRGASSMNEASINKPNYFYHLLPKGLNIDKITSLDYQYHHDKALFHKNSYKYRDRLCNGWGIYPGRNPKDLTDKEVYEGINKFRKTLQGNNQIYLFKYPLYKDLGPQMRKILDDKDIYRLDINDIRVRKLLMDVDWGWEGSNTDNRKLSADYYANVTPEEYFSKYTEKSNGQPLFAPLNHISITPMNGYIPIDLWEKIDVPENMMECAIDEGYILSDKDYEYRLQEFKDKKINVVFLIGVPGSGKSTLSRKLSEENRNIKHAETDLLFFNYYMDEKKLRSKDTDGVITDFLLNSSLGQKYRFKGGGTKELNKRMAENPSYQHDMLLDFAKYCKSKSSGNNQIIIDGYWPIIILKASEIKDYAILVKNTSNLLSYFRALHRNMREMKANTFTIFAASLATPWIPQFYNHLELQSKLNKFIEDLKSYDKHNESAIDEAGQSRDFTWVLHPDFMLDIPDSTYDEICALLDKTPSDHIYLTSDWHLFKYHYKTDFETYSFRKSYDMINWCRKNMRKDDVFIYLGDLSYKTANASDKARVSSVFKSIPGKKILILGNHDVDEGDQSFWYNSGFDYVLEELKWKNIIFSHIPLAVKPNEINIHGHIHTIQNYYDPWVPKQTVDGKRHLNVYPSLFDNKPVTLKYLLANKNQQFKSHYNRAPVQEASNITNFKDLKFKTMDEIFRWVESNIKPENPSPNAWRLKTPEQVFNTKCGNSHDQAYFMRYLLQNAGFSPKLYFMKEYDNNNRVGRTHTVCVCMNKNRLEWIENCWSKMNGHMSEAPQNSTPQYVRFEYEGNWEKNSQYPNFSFVPAAICKYGCTLDEYIASNSKQREIRMPKGWREASILESISASERRAIPQKSFGIPEDRKFPLDSEKHVRSAIHLFGHASEDKKKALARRISSAARKYGIEIPENTQVHKYLHSEQNIFDIDTNNIIVYREQDDQPILMDITDINHWQIGQSPRINSTVPLSNYWDTLASATISEVDKAKANGEFNNESSITRYVYISPYAFMEGFLFGSVHEEPICIGQISIYENGYYEWDVQYPLRLNESEILENPLKEHMAMSSFNPMISGSRYMLLNTGYPDLVLTKDIDSDIGMVVDPSGKLTTINLPSDTPVYEAYEYVGPESNLKRLNEIYKHNLCVESNMYELLSDREQVTDDQIDYDPLFNKINFDEIAENTETNLASFQEQIIATMLNTNIPVLESVYIDNVPFHDDVTLREDCDGYYYFSELTNKRSRSVEYSSLLTENMLKSVIK